MKFSKGIKVNLGNYETLALEVSECDSFLDCDAVLDAELNRLGLNKHKGAKT